MGTSIRIMTPQIKSKEAKTIAASNASKEKKKKWSKGRSKEKAIKLCLFERDLYKKFISDVPKYKMISVSVLTERLGINGSLARAAIKELIRNDLITTIFSHGKLSIFKGSNR